MKKNLLFGALAVVAMLVVGCNDDSAGDKMENAADKTGDALENAGDKTGDALEKAGDKTEDALK